MAEFYTVQLGKVRGMKIDFPVHNITVKNGIRAFAPTWDIVMGVKNGSISEEEYIDKYLKLMRISYSENSEVWRELIEGDLFAIGCFCNHGDFCHRYLLADMFVKCGCKYLGELT